MLDKHFTPQTIETKIQQTWDQARAFHYDPHITNDSFCIIMPPPNVTGSLHMGHALTFTLQDILTRHHRKMGRHVLWQPGTDHAGIATQMVVERQLDSEGLSRFDLGREAFLERVWAWKAESGGAIHRQLRRLGASAPWERDCFTMDDHISATVRKVFRQLHADGLIYRDKRLVHWDVKLQSAISDVEVVNKPAQTPFYFIRYLMAHDANQSITIATTRPETLFGDAAISVNPKDKRYQHLIGCMALVPFSDRAIPIIADEWSDPEKGTGAVKITPAHDFNDHEVGKRHNLAPLTIMDLNGKLNDQVPPPFQGLDRFAARNLVVEKLRELDQLVGEEMISNTVPHGDRSDTILEPLLTDQWYVNAAALAHKAIAAVEDNATEFVPPFWASTYFEWMGNIQPWCISRQIWWGHRIPAWYGPDGHVFVAESAEEASHAALSHYKKPVVLTQDPDVLDTWFSSALWPFVTLGWPEATPELAKHYPSAVLITGNDIIFFWVARMMMLGLYIMGKVPFRHVYIHALVRDEKGQKMSKSKGNVVDPMGLIEEFGADALRLTLALQAAPGRDIKFSPSRIEGAKHFITKLWNATRFSLMNQCTISDNFNPSTVSHPVNGWIVEKVEALRSSIMEALETYRFHEAAHELYQSVWATFCDWYLEFTKPLLQETDENIAKETQYTTAWALARYLELLNPFIPFVTEELWATLHKVSGLSSPLLCLAPYAGTKAQSLTHKNTATAGVTWAIALIEEIRSICAVLGLPSGIPLCVTLYTPHKDEAAFVALYGNIIRRMARLQSLEVNTSGSAPETVGSLLLPFGSGLLYIPLGDVLDITKEAERLSKEINKAKKEMEGTDKKLNNPEFLSKAPEEIISELKTRRMHMSTTLAKLTDAHGRFQAF